MSCCTCCIENNLLQGSKQEQKCAAGQSTFERRENRMGGLDPKKASLVFCRKLGFGLLKFLELWSNNASVLCFGLEHRFCMILPSGIHVMVCLEMACENVPAFCACLQPSHYQIDPQGRWANIFESRSDWSMVCVDEGMEWVCQGLEKHPVSFPSWNFCIVIIARPMLLAYASGVLLTFCSGS